MKHFRLFCLIGNLCWALGASHRTPNFIVEAPTPELAKQIGDTAETLRDEKAILWTGEKFPRWSSPCPITADVGDLPAAGCTSFKFDNGEVFGWDMKISGTRELILSSVLPHEITHTIFATHFRQPLPRWADEGACTTMEAAGERNKQRTLLVGFLQSQKGIPTHELLAMREYPPDVLPLYAQSYSLASYLIELKGRGEFMAFLDDGLHGDWRAAVQTHYDFPTLQALQDAWLESFQLSLR